MTTKISKGVGTLARNLFILGTMGVSLYVWIEILGGFSFRHGLKVFAAIAIFVGIANLPTEAQWAKTIKGATLVVFVVWIIADMLPITTPGAWLASLLLAGFVGLIGYIILFEDFFS